MAAKLRWLIALSVLFLFSMACSFSGQDVVDVIKTVEVTQGVNQQPTEPRPEPIATITSLPPTPSPTPEPDSEQILFVDQSAAYLLDLETMQSDLVAENVHYNNVRLSPDGRLLAYLESYQNPDLYMVGRLVVKDLETGEIVTLSNVPEDIETFTWSPQPGVITLTRRNYRYCMGAEDQGISGVYAYDVTAGTIETLVEGTDQFVFWVGEWSPDGRYLSFTSGPDCSEGFNFYFYDSQTGDVTAIPFSLGAWSSDGRALAVHNIAYYDAYDIPLEKYDINTQETETIAGKPGFMADSPAWSPVDAWIAFDYVSVSAYNQRSSWLLNVDSGELIELPIENARTAFWSPDGAFVVLSVSEDQTKDVYIVEASTGESTKILEDITGNPIQWVD